MKIGFGIGHRSEIDCIKNLTNVMIGSHSPQSAWRDTGNRRGFAAPSALSPGPGADIERVLHCTRHAAIVLGGDEQNSIARLHLFSKPRPRLRRRSCFEILVVMRQRAD